MFSGGGDDVAVVMVEILLMKKDVFVPFEVLGMNGNINNVM